MKGKFGLMWRVLIVLVLVLTLGLVTAVPALATGEYGTWYLANGGTGGAAAWSTTQAHDDTYSAAIGGGTESGTSYGQVWKPVDITLANITDISFWHYLSSSSQFDHSSWPMYLEEGETYADNTGYFTPYVTLKITDGTTDHYLISQPFVRDPDNGTWTAGWEQWQMSDNAAASGGHDPTEALWHMEDFSVDDAGTGGAGAYPAGWEYLSYWQTYYSGYDVVQLKVSMGWWAITTDQTAYVDDITVTASATQYAVEPRVFIGATPYGAIDTAIANAAVDDTINVSSGTFCAQTFPIDVNVSGLTIQSVSGAATTIIDPGSSGQGVLKINQENVTIDGFTIKGGSQAYTASDPQENAIWIMDNYSTIENNTIINYRGNQAGIYIGDGQAGVPTGAVFGYKPATPADSRLGHTIEDNTFRQAGSGEGWGIFAYDLSDSLIHGNTFVGDAADSSGWNTDEGAPGTGIIIHTATADVGSPSPGGGYVIIEDNTARYMKYSWLTFSAAYMYTDSVGYGYEQPENSTVDKVIVRNNTVQDCGTAIVFSGAKKSSAYGDKFADLTVGSNKVTIGQGNTIFNNGDGIRIDAPKLYSGSNYGSVVVADTILIQYNDIYTNTLDTSSWWGTPDGYGVRNLTSSLDGGPDTVDALYNYWGDPSGPTVAANARGAGDTITATIVTYEPWLHTTQATVYPSGTRYYAYNWCDLTTGWNIWSTPIAPDSQADTWGEYKALGVDLDLATGANAYYFDASTPAWASVTDSYSLSPCDAIYIKVASTEEAPILFSPSYSAPTKTLYAGWNLVSASYIDNMDSPTITNGIDPQDCLASVYTVAGANNTGYSQVVSPAVNQGTAWTGYRGTTIDADVGGANTMKPCKGYWVFMTNAGTLAGTVFTPVSPLLP